MRSLVYHVEFIGGPSDGLVIDATRLSFRPKKRLSLSVSPVLVQHARTKCYEYVGQTSSTYLMTSRQYREADGGPAVHLRYEFLAFQYENRTARTTQAVTPRRRWPMTLLFATRHVWKKLANWMLTPIPYPLKIVGPEVRVSDAPSVNQVGPR
jgi:hypothetical protein